MSEHPKDHEYVSVTYDVCDVCGWSRTQNVLDELWDAYQKITNLPPIFVSRVDENGVPIHETQSGYALANLMGAIRARLAPLVPEVKAEPDPQHDQ